MGEEFKLKLEKNTFVIQNIAFFPDLTSSEGNYRVNFNFGTITKIVKWLRWQNNFSDTYVTNPPAGKNQNDLVFASGLRVAFSTDRVKASCNRKLYSGQQRKARHRKQQVLKA